MAFPVGIGLSVRLSKLYSILVGIPQFEHWLQVHIHELFTHQSQTKVYNVSIEHINCSVISFSHYSSSTIVLTVIGVLNTTVVKQQLLYYTDIRSRVITVSFY